MRGKPARVGGGDGEGDGFFCRVVEMQPRFQLQRAVGGYFKACIADGVAVRVARIGVCGRQFADARTVFALGDGRRGKGDVGRCVILRR